MKSGLSVLPAATTLAGQPAATVPVVGAQRVDSADPQPSPAPATWLARAYLCGLRGRSWLLCRLGGFMSTSLGGSGIAGIRAEASQGCWSACAAS
jgi:hypothetical protein